MLIVKSILTRIGAEDYMFNRLVNEIENENLYHGFKIEEDNFVLNIEQIKNEFSVVIRCYIDEQGWETFNYTLKPIDKNN